MTQSPIHIRIATPSDAGILTEIAHASKRHWGYPESYIEIWKNDLTLTADFLNNHPVYLACIDNQIAGFCAISGDVDDREIEHFWVLPKYMGYGVGRRLFEHMLNAQTENGAKSIRILADPYAEGFYEKMGAVTVDAEASSVIPGRSLPVMRYDIDNR